MMLTLGVLGFIQTFFLPGAVILRALGFRANVPTCLLMGAALSLAFNFFFIFLLVALGLYASGPLYLIFILEIALLLSMRKRKSVAIFSFDDQTPFTPVEIGFGVSAILVFLFYATRWIKSWGTIIHWTDAVFSWNRWALEWTHSTMPTVTKLYPQLIAVVYSIGYQFIQSTEVQFFSLSAVTFFPILGALAFLSLIWVDSRLRIWASVSTVLFLFFVNRIAVPLSGYADGPLATMILLLFLMVFLQVQERFKKHSMVLFYFGSFLAGMVAMTKQAAIPVALLYPVLICGVEGRWIGLKRIFKSYLIIGAVLTPWYGYKFSQILLGVDDSGVGGIVAAVVIPFGKRIPDALLKLYLNFLPQFSAPTLVAAYLVIIGACVWGMKKSNSGKIFGMFVMVWFFFWALVASYDVRNFSPAIPALSMMIGFAVESWFKNPARKAIILERKFRFGWVGGLIFIVSVMIAQLAIPDRVLIEHQKAQQIDFDLNGVK